MRNRAGLLAATALTFASGLFATPAFAQVAEIVVTAQRRAEKLQDVPIAVSATSGEDAEAKGITGTIELAETVPSLQSTNLSGRAIFSLRGVGNSSVAVGEESIVAVYVDGVYINSLNGSLFSFNNIERVEVLKGPQGTLFGRNAVGGVINITTSDPSPEPQLDVRVGYGNYDTFEGSLYGSVGFSDDVAMDVAFYGNDRSGSWGTNLTTGEEVYHGSEWAVRSKLKADIGERTDVRLIGEASENRSQLGIAFGIPEGTIGADGMSTNVGYYDSTLNFEPFGITERHGGSANLVYSADFADLISITSYYKTTNQYFLDQDGTPVPIVDVIVNSTVKTFTQEFQLASNNDGPLTWLLGFYYLDSSGAFDPLVIGGFAAAPLPFQNIFTTQDTESYAGFGQATYDITERTSVTAGLRYTSDKQSFEAVVQGPGGIVLADPPDQSETFDKLTWRFAVNHELADDVMAYVSYDRGFKSGVFNTVAPFDPAVRPSVIDAYQIGIKTLLADRRVRLNAAAFRYDYEDIQLQRAAAGATQLFNAASARIYGADIDLEVSVADGFDLTAGLGWLDSEFIDFPDAPIVTPIPGGGGNTITPGDFSGRDLPSAPEWTASLGLLYTQDTPIGELQFAANASYMDEFLWAPGSEFTEPDKFLLNGSIQLTTLDERFDIRLWARNITDQEYAVYGNSGQLGNLYTPAPPRTFGVTLGMHFGP